MGARTEPCRQTGSAHCLSAPQALPLGFPCFAYASARSSGSAEESRVDGPNYLRLLRNLPVSYTSQHLRPTVRRIIHFHQVCGSPGNYRGHNQEQNGPSNNNQRFNH
ncbi:hypothetical protein NDU88_003126 [Pleurodeles waltl]|uniref:Uncharacterized protein n=1 Tax=Pleurodeles waltl TaxID=8319 RepID=A0AAV7RFD3_PLEWA|nr:hypothetical protein NDU88_003126 [Pleurodeles waltl]